MSKNKKVNFSYQIKCMGIMSDSMKLFTNILNFMDPGTGVQTIGWGQEGHLVIMIKIFESN